MVRQGNSDLQRDEDEQREKVLSEMMLRIVRFGNDEVLRSLPAVAGRIRALLKK
jgi:very-short-patch-repair endonuclease